MVKQGRRGVCINLTMQIVALHPFERKEIVSVVHRWKASREMTQPRRGRKSLLLVGLGDTNGDTNDNRNDDD